MAKRMKLDEIPSCAATAAVLPVIPRNYHQLGENILLGVSTFRDHVYVHIRRYAIRESDQLEPTKSGLALSPETWATFSEEIPAMMEEDNHYGALLMDRIFVSSEGGRKSPRFIHLQYASRFSDSVQLSQCCLKLSTTQFCRLLELRENVTLLIQRELLGPLFKKFVRQELESMFAFDEREESDLSSLTTSLIRTLTRMVGKNLLLLVPSCVACRSDEICENQLGHTCQPPNLVVDHYFNRAVLSIAIDKLASIFVLDIIARCGMITDAFLDGLDSARMLKCCAEQITDELFEQSYCYSK